MSEICSELCVTLALGKFYGCADDSYGALEGFWVDIVVLHHETRIAIRNPHRPHVISFDWCQPNTFLRCLLGDVYSFRARVHAKNEVQPGVALFE